MADLRAITSPIMPYITKTIFSMSKINPTMKWSFENSSSGLELSYEDTKVDYPEITQPMKTFFGAMDSSDSSHAAKYFEAKGNTNCNVDEEGESKDKMKY